MTVRRRLSWGIWSLTIIVLGAALSLAVRNGSLSQDPFFAAIAIVMMVGYVSIGALVASRFRATRSGGSCWRPGPGSS